MELVSKITGLSRNAVKKMLKNGVFWVEWDGEGLSERRCPRKADNSKQADLRAFWELVEGLYPFDGVVRFTGISEGFMGKE